MNTVSFNFLHSVISTWKTHGLVKCEQYSLADTGIVNGSR